MGTQCNATYDNEFYSTKILKKDATNLINSDYTAPIDYSFHTSINKNMETCGEISVYAIQGCYQYGYSKFSANSQEYIPWGNGGCNTYNNVIFVEKGSKIIAGAHYGSRIVIKTGI